MTEMGAGGPAEALAGRWRGAVDDLREELRPRAVEVANDVLSAVLSSSRSSLPIQVQGPHDYVFVSDAVLIGTIRQLIDDSPAPVATGAVVLGVERISLVSVTVEVFVQYGAVLVEVADQARVLVGKALRDVLGLDVAASVTVLPAHVHVSDITRGDPTQEDPGEAGITT